MEKQDGQNAVKLTLFDWIGRVVIALIGFFAYNIYLDVKTLVVVVPVLQERIQTIEQKVERMENKVFMDDRFQYPYPEMKKEDEITIDKQHK